MLESFFLVVVVVTLISLPIIAIFYFIQKIYYRLKLIYFEKINRKSSDNEENIVGLKAVNFVPTIYNIRNQTDDSIHNFSSHV